ncbi:rCG30910 [Rattus norvegicus]|uniref:RCG30910 n=1 Tax=Rattus norvegicus TaxID=10116 RepID=A6ISG9_RAT|nr:rCG30910 [Rattus norvegicus]
MNSESYEIPCFIFLYLWCMPVLIHTREGRSLHTCPGAHTCAFSTK